MDIMQPVPSRFDRREGDVGNIVEFGHVNVFVPDQRLATAFYVGGLGLTRDPYMMTGTDNMWINVGRSQFHLPTGPAQVVGGIIELLVPDRAALLTRLAAVRHELADTCFDFRDGSHGPVVAFCPWGNQIRLDTPRHSRDLLAIAGVAFVVPPGTAAGIARFYTKILGARATVEESASGQFARVPVSATQNLTFQETTQPIDPHDGNHIQITLADFSGPYQRLLAHGLITEESNAHQYRFATIIDPDDGTPLFTVEHEVRSMRHPMFNRPLICRNPAQTARDYRPGRDALIWSDIG